MPNPEYIAKTNALTEMALEEAKKILQFGPAQQKIQVIRSVLGVLARQAAAGQDTAATEMRLRMEILMTEMRKVPQLTKVVGERDFIDAEVLDAVEIDSD